MAGNAKNQAELHFDAQADCAMLTLTLYEVLLTFDHEVRLVWQRKFNGATLLFLLNRYVSLLRLSVIIFVVLLFSDELSPFAHLSCSYGPFLVAGLEYGLLLIVAVFFGLRVYALTGHSMWPALLVFALLVVPFITNTYIVTLSTARTLPPPLFCITSIHISQKLYEQRSNDLKRLVSILTRTCVFVGDLCVVLVTWYTTYRTWRAGRTARFKASLSTLLLRDGIADTRRAFSVILILSALQLLFLFYNDVRNIETTFADTLMPLLISRLILNLREFDAAGNSTSVASSGSGAEKTATVMFASAPGTDSDSDSDSGSFLEENMKGDVTVSESSGSFKFAAFVDPLGAPVDDALDWHDEEEADATAHADDVRVAKTWEV
ncbi:hypothetical protein C8T65DRAFT_662297 [Cerioporus squamosus]|nr:hypothetical protein C8T65DRAFT_662297 [Cerioporus squamosus]